MENYKDFEREEAYLRAKKKVEKIVGFYWHFGIYLAVNIFIWVSILINIDPGESFWKFGHFSTFIFWGIGVFFHFIGVFGDRWIFGKNWEDKKIKKIMDKEKNEQWQ